MNSMTAAEEAGVTYRQLDHWIRRGFIKGSLPGTGTPRNIREAEFRVLMVMATLVHAGMKPEAAGPLARQLAAGAPHVTVSGVRISLTTTPGHRFVCPACGRQVAARKDGLLRAHRPTPSTRSLCVGSRTSIEEVAA